MSSLFKVTMKWNFAYLFILKYWIHDPLICNFRVWASDKNARIFSSASKLANRPRSMYQNSNMTPRLSEKTSVFGTVFFVSNSVGNWETKEFTSCPENQIKAYRVGYETRPRILK